MKSAKTLLSVCLFLLMNAPGAFATQVIANWDVVPFQRFSQPFKAGVVAFHETGVDVDFRINGVAAGCVTDSTWNDRTGVYEYWIEINPAAYTDGPITVSATAVPDDTNHQSRVLSDLTLYADAGDTLTTHGVKWADADNGSDTTGNGSEANPYQTIKKAVLSVGNGGTVYLKASPNYILQSIGNAGFTQWTTVTCAPGLTADDVHIGTYTTNDVTGTGRYGTSMVRWGQVSFYCDRAPGWGSIFYLNTGQRTWFDGSVMYDKNGRWADSTTINGSDPYCTDCYVHDMMNVNNTGILQRGMRYERIASDIFRGADNLTAINTEIRLVDLGETAAHPDFFQFYNNDVNDWMENIIIYNCKSYDMNAQGIFGSKLGGARDVAFVNLLLEKDPPDSYLTSQVSGSMDHVLLWHATLVDQTFSFRDTAGMFNWDVRNCVFNTCSAGSLTALPTCTISDNLVKLLTWEQKSPLGLNTIVGDPGFADYDNDDYRLQTNSPAYQSGMPLPGVPADVDGYPYDPVNPSRGVFSAANPGGAHPATNSVSFNGISITPAGTNTAAVLRASFTGNARSGYTAESSSNLQNWIPLVPRLAAYDGSFDIAENVEGSSASRFYRFTLR